MWVRVKLEAGPRPADSLAWQATMDAKEDWTQMEGEQDVAARVRRV